jgi:hypothetical protein
MLEFMTGMPQRETVPIAPDDSRKQLGAFCAPGVKASIRSVSVCRERAAAHAGSAPGRGGDAGRCRRDLVHLAGGGREVNPSESVLVGVANALQCSPLETRHLFVPALTPPEPRRSTYVKGIAPGPGGCSIA